MSSPAWPSPQTSARPPAPDPTQTPHQATLIDLADRRQQMMINKDVRAAVELAYELSLQIAALDLPSALPIFFQGGKNSNSPAPSAGEATAPQPELCNLSIVNSPQPR